MVREIPEAVRAAAGLAATVLDEARKLPETLPGLPVRLLGLAMQTSLRLQQQYSGLVARGDEVFTGLLGDAEPGRATFDEDLPAPPPTNGRPAPRSSAFDLVDDEAEEPADDLTVELSDEIADIGDPAVDVLEVDQVAEAVIEALADDDTALDDAALDDAALEDAALEDSPLADVLVLEDSPLADVLVLESLGGDTTAGISDAEVALLPDDPAADAITEAVDELAGAVDAELAADLPGSVGDEVADDLADDLAADTVAVVAGDKNAAEVPAGLAGPAGIETRDEITPDQAPDEVATLDEAAPDVTALDEATEDVVDLGAVEPVVADGDVSAIAAEPDAPGAFGAAGPVDEPRIATAPVEGYDSFSIPALRGHLRGYPTETVTDLLDYERATRSRAPYVTLLQNRLEKLSADRG